MYNTRKMCNIVVQQKQDDDMVEAEKALIKNHDHKLIVESDATCEENCDEACTVQISAAAPSTQLIVDASFKQQQSFRQTLLIACPIITVLIVTSLAALSEITSYIEVTAQQNTLTAAVKIINSIASSHQQSDQRLAANLDVATAGPHSGIEPVGAASGDLLTELEAVLSRTSHGQAHHHHSLLSLARALDLINVQKHIGYQFLSTCSINAEDRQLFQRADVQLAAHLHTAVNFVPDHQHVIKPVIESNDKHQQKLAMKETLGSTNPVHKCKKLRNDLLEVSTWLVAMTAHRNDVSDATHAVIASLQQTIYASITSTQQKVVSYLVICLIAFVIGYYVSQWHLQISSDLSNQIASLSENITQQSSHIQAEQTKTRSLLQQILPSDVTGEWTIWLLGVV